MSKRILGLLFVGGISLVFLATTLYAGSEFQDEISMDYNEYTKRKYTPPTYEVFVFTHKKHYEEYKISCGDCHHDKDGNPLDLKIGDEVQQCVECHNEVKKTKKNKKSITLLENAMHENCKVCHMQANIEAGDPKGKKGPAPMLCKQCHIKVEVKK